MKKMKSTLLLTLSIVLMSALFLSACGKGEKEVEGAKPAEGDKVAESSFVFGETPVDFSFYGHYDWYTMKPWGGDITTKWIQDNKKVNIEAVQSGGNADQKFNTMVASKDLPDVIWLERGKDVEKLRSAGLLVSFDEYLDKYPNLKKWAGESTLNMLRSADGKLYQFPNWYTSRPNGNAGYMLNKKIYDDLGAPVIETYDDLYAYLKLVKDKMPNVVPFDPGIQGQGIDIMYSGFAEDHPVTNVSIRAVPKGDQLTSLFADPVYVESLQYASKLFREKLISQDALTQTKDQVDEKINTGRVAVFAASSATDFGAKGQAALVGQDPTHPGYMMIWPVHKEGVDKNKVYPGHYGQLGWNVSVITKNAENPEGVFAFLDWLTGDEGSRTIMWGPEGLYWDGVDEDGSPKFTDKYFSDPQGLADLMNKTLDFQWNGNTTYIDTAKSKIEMKLPEEQRNWETKWQMEITWPTQFNNTQFVNLDPMPDSNEGIIRQTIEDLFMETRAKALYAKSDEEVASIMKKAEESAQKLGYDQLLKVKTEKWQENVKKMNGES